MRPERLPLAVVGGGPAGLMAAEAAAARGWAVDVFDAMPSPGRKFLMAGRGGLNITHAESEETFLGRYGEARPALAAALAAFGPGQVRDWMAGLGIESFVGTSGRVFPVGMKAAPLFRAWLRRLGNSGVRLHVRHRWVGWDEAGGLRFATPAGERSIRVGATVFAMGGGSWRRLGSDAAWVPHFMAQGIDVAPLRPANCGFEVCWSESFRQRFAGHPVKTVSARHGDKRLTGEFVVTRHGVEGGLIYALAAPLRDALAAGMPAIVHLDLVPGRSEKALAADLARPRGRDTLANHLRRRAGIVGVKAALLRERVPADVLADSHRLAGALKDLPLALEATRPLDEAISTAGGVRFSCLDAAFMLRAHPGVFCAGEMLDWEAPTGGYLLTACLATGRRAGEAAAAWLENQSL